MKRFLIKLIAPALIILSSLTFAVQFAHADSFGLDETAKSTTVFKDAVAQKKTLPTLVGDILGIALSLVGLVFLGFAVYGGFRWMTAQGDTKMVTEGRETLINATIGIVLIMSAYVLTNFIFSNVATQINAPATGGGGNSADQPCINAGGQCGPSANCTSPKTTHTGLCSGGTDNVCCY